MRSSQVLIFGNDSKLTALLEGLIVERERCPLLHPRDAKECLELMKRGWQSVLVLKVGRDVEEEINLLSQVSALHPDTATVVIAEAIHAPLAGLAWDLGAAYVLFLPQPRELLPEIVAGLLRPAAE
jgi:DNA-binding NtrC family response regulator